MSDAKHDTKHADHAVKAKDLEPLKADPDKARMTAPARDAARAPKAEKPRTLHEKLDAIKGRVEAASNSPVADGKAEEFADCWDELDEIGTPEDQDNPADAAMVQAAHNHLQHHAPRHASRIEALEAELDRAVKEHEKPQAKPDTPELAHVKARIADLQTEIANDPRALPGDKQRAQELQRKVTTLNMEKAAK